MHPLLIEGLTDALGFVAGALVALVLARLAGLDPLAAGYDTASITGILILGLGGGIGVNLARRLRARGKRKAD